MKLKSLKSFYEKNEKLLAGKEEISNLIGGASGANTFGGIWGECTSGGDDCQNYSHDDFGNPTIPIGPVEYYINIC